RPSSQPPLQPAKDHSNQPMPPHLCKNSSGRPELLFLPIHTGGARHRPKDTSSPLESGRLPMSIYRFRRHRRGEVPLHLCWQAPPHGGSRCLAVEEASADQNTRSFLGSTWVWQKMTGRVVRIPPLCRPEGEIATNRQSGRNHRPLRVPKNHPPVGPRGSFLGL